MENNLPEGWTEVELHEVAADINYPIGDGDHGQIKPSMYKDKGVPYIRVSDMGWGNFKPNNLVYIDKATHEANLKSELKPGDVLIAKTGATIGKCCIVPDEVKRANTTSSVGKVTLDERLMHPKWLLNFFLSREFKDFMWSISVRTAQPGFNIRDMVKFKIPLPPKTEHDLIVAKLDALMQKVESNKHRLEKIPIILKRFRQSVLAAAVSGKLTEEWREQNKKVEIYPTKNKVEDYNWKDFDFPESWNWEYTKNLGEHILGKMLDAAKNKGEPTFYLRNVSVRWFDFDLNSLTEIKATPEDKKKFDLRNGDVFICEGGEPGRAAIWNKGENDLIFQKAIHRIRLNKFVNPYWYLFNIKLDTDSGKLETLFTGTGIKHLTLKSLSKYPIPLPPLEEQIEIAKQVEQLFAFADKIESRYTKAKALLDKLPQSILAKAFRGELVPQNPNDEPASVLLERIKKEKKMQKSNIPNGISKTRKQRAAAK